MMLGEGSSASLTEDHKITGYLHLEKGVTIARVQADPGGALGEIGHRS